MQTSKYVIQKPENLLDNSGIPITIADIHFWICNYQGIFHVLYDECSHMGGALKATSSNLVCTVHGWTYNFDGRNLNVKQIRIRTLTNTYFILRLASITVLGVQSLPATSWFHQ